MPRRVSILSLLVAFCFLLLQTAGVAAGQSAKVYWTDFGPTKVQRANTDGTNVEDLVISPSVQPFEIAIDGTSSHLYWTETVGSKIQRSDMDGSNIIDVVTGLDTPRGIAVDETNGKLYWTDWGTQKIQRSNLDGSNVEDLVTGLSVPRGIVLDVSGSKMYWTDSGTSKIQRANLDGSGLQDLISTGLNTTVGIDIDVSGGKMYWTDQMSATVHRADLDGSNQQTIVSTGLLDPSYISVDPVAGKIYWTDFGTSWVQSANLDGSSVANIVTAGLIIPTGIALAPSAALPVELATFDVVVDEAAAHLSWSTVSEVNAAGFDIQYSTGGNWRDAGFVGARGSESVGAEYAFSIDNLQSGRHVFRLKQIDLDGSFEYSASIEAVVVLETGVNVGEPYPNPATENVTMRLSSDRSSSVTVTLHDVQGRTIETVFMGVLDDSGLILSIGRFNLASGVYFLRVEDQLRVQTKRIVLVD